MSQYNKFATVYDLMGADHFSREMVAYVTLILKRYKITPVTCLDLCCGTGSAIEGLLDLGLDVSGLDGSAQMLAIAAKKLKGRKVKLYHKTLPRFKLLDTIDSRQQRRFDLVTCFYDSLNYMKNETELKAAFKSVYQHLKPGGHFIFDMNTAESLKTLWDEHIYAGQKKDMAWIWENEYLPKKKAAKCHATFFVKNGKSWQRFDEVHTEYAYSNTKIKKLLKDAGFKIKGFHHCLTFQAAKRDSYRIAVIANRPDKS